MHKVLSNPFLRYGLMITVAATAIAIMSPNFFGGLFRADEFMPHATCYLRNPKIILLHVSSDLVIGISYLGIALMLGYIVYKGSEDLPFHSIFLAFGLFIVSCGLTHLMEVWTVWQAVYWLAGYIKAITAAASLATAVALALLTPRIIGFVETARLSERRRIALETANEELNAFAYSVSHDLRAPLRAVQGMSSALMEDFGTKLEPDAKAYLDRILAASERMDTLIRDMLEYSRVSRAEIELVPVRVEESVREAELALAAAANEPGAQIQIDVKNATVLASKPLLVQVLANLLGNAIKFMPQGQKPQVQVWTEALDGNIRINIQDNGIGIAPEYHDKIFRIFERLHSVSEYPGTGIGLAIVQKGVLRMRGQLGFESEVDKGSRFWIELPKAPRE
jgi:signal transduction histidine kinase